MFVFIIEYFLFTVKKNTRKFSNITEVVYLIYTKVQELCTKNQITIYKLEKELGFPNASICKWKNSNPTVDKLKKVADYFGVPIEYFLEEV